MLLIRSFIFCGLICLISQIVLDNTKLTPGHITSILVVIGGLLDFSNIYDKIINFVGGGAMLPITSFGHSLVHGAIGRASDLGLVGVLMGVFDLTSAGIAAAVFFSFVFALIFKPKN